MENKDTLRISSNIFKSTDCYVFRGAFSDESKKKYNNVPKMSKFENKENNCKTIDRIKTESINQQRRKK